jgi:hypothetical protein
VSPRRDSLIELSRNEGHELREVRATDQAIRGNPSGAAIRAAGLASDGAPCIAAAPGRRAGNRE